MSMDKYFSWDAQFPFLAVHDSLKGMNIFPRCVNFYEALNLLAMHNFLRVMKSSRDS